MAWTRWGRAGAAALVTAAGLAGCVNGRPDCGEGPGFDARLEQPDGWDEVLEVRTVGEPRDPPNDRTVELEVVLRDGDAATVTAHERTAVDLAIASTTGHRVLVGWWEGRDIRTAVADVDGRAVFLGVCGGRASEHLDALADPARGGTFALVEEWTAERSDSTLGRILRPLGPDEVDRALTGGELDEVTASMIPLSVVIEAPSAWADPDLVIATRVPAGWNDGVPLTAASRPGGLPITGFADPGDDLEVVVFGGDEAGVLVVGSAPVTPPEGWVPGAPLQVTVHISGPPAESPLPDLPTGIELPLGATVTLDVRA